MKTTFRIFIHSLFLLLFFTIISFEINAQWSELSVDDPPPRINNTMVEINGIIYSFGGNDDNGDFGDTWAFEGGQWVNKYPALAPGPRHGHTAVAANGKMYLFGGSGSGFLLNDLWEYCPENNTWKQITTTGSAPSPRMGHTAVYHEGTNTIYVMGGTTSEGGSSELFALDMNTKQWTQKADMLNFNVTNHGTGILNDLLIIFGGNSSFAPFSDHFFTYDLATDTWASIDDIMGDDFLGRSDFAFTQTDDAILVFGGTNDDIVFEDPFGDHLMIEMDENNRIMMTELEDEPIFADGFESGNATAWTNDVPKGASSGSTKILLFGGLSGGDYINSTWLYTECETITDSIEVSICEGESYEGYQEEGVYEDTFEVHLGCDSVRTLNLTVLPKLNMTIVMELCHGEFYEGYSESGTYEDLFSGSNGCDSIRSLELTIFDEIADTIMTSVCYGESYEGYSESGLYEDVFPANNGCDSTRILDLDIDDPILETVMTTICSGETFAGYSEAGIYEDVFDAVNGCDSTRVLDLEITQGIEVTDTTIIADSGSGNGSIMLSINDNNEAFIFEWSNGEATSSISDLEHGDYSVTVTNEFDCSEIFEFTVDLNTSTYFGDIIYDFEVSPNPIEAQMKLSFANPQGILGIQKIRIVDMQGGVIKTWNRSSLEIRNNELWLGNISSGVYLLQLLIKNKVYAKKVVVFR